MAGTEYLDDSWRKHLLYHTARFVSFWGFTLGFSFRYEGMANMPKRGPVLLVANHQSYLDPPAIGVAVGRPLVYLARKTLFRNPIFSSIIRGLGAVPIDQEGVGKEGLRVIIEQLQKQRPVLVFPEGTRTEHGAMNALKPGIHLLIKRTRVPILPVGIAGFYDAWAVTKKCPSPSPLFTAPTKSTLAVSIGKPFDTSIYEKLPREEVLIDLHRRIGKLVERAEALRRKEKE